MVPAWTEPLLADLNTGCRVRQVRRATGLASSLSRSRGPTLGRGSRSSVAIRRRCASSVLRDGVVELDGALPDGIPTDQGMLAALESSLLAQYTSPKFDDLPPLHGGIMGFLGYDVISARSSTSRTPRPDDRSYPDAVMSVIGVVGGVRPPSSTRLPHRERAHPRSRPRPTRCRLRRCDRSRAAGGGRPLCAAASVHARRTAVGRRRAARAPLLDAQRDVPAPPSTSPDHVVAGDIFQVVLAERYDLELGAYPFDVHRVLRQVEPVALHVLRASPRTDDRRLVTEADGAVAGPHGRVTADRRHPTAGSHRRARPDDGRRADRAPQGARRARDARRPRP